MQNHLTCILNENIPCNFSDIFIFYFVNKNRFHHKLFFWPYEIRSFFSDVLIFLSLFKRIKRTDINAYPAEHAKSEINRIYFGLPVIFRLDNFNTVLRAVFFTYSAARALVS